MSEMTMQLVSTGSCRVAHGPSGAILETDLAPEYGGGGRSFSSTDLLAAALGSCILTSLERIADREGLDSRRIWLTVEKNLSTSPKAIRSIAVRIHLPPETTDQQLKKLRKAAQTCVVHESLVPAIAVPILFSRPTDKP